MFILPSTLPVIPLSFVTCSNCIIIYISLHCHVCLLGGAVGGWGLCPGTWVHNGKYMPSPSIRPAPPPGAVCKSGYPRANNTSSTSFWHQPQQPSARLAVAESEGSPVAQIIRAHVPGCSHTVRGAPPPPSLSLSLPPPPPSPAL